jgi:hypothetical protein
LEKIYQVKDGKAATASNIRHTIANWKSLPRVLLWQFFYWVFPIQSGSQKDPRHLLMPAQPKAKGEQSAKGFRKNPLGEPTPRRRRH